MLKTDFFNELRVYSFEDLRDGPARYVAARLLKIDISGATSMQHMATALCDRIGRTETTTLAERYLFLSSGEQAVALALITFADYARLADELADGRGFRIITQASGRHAHAVAAMLE